MNFEQFQKQMIDEMAKRFPDIEFGAMDVNKLQGQSYSGMSVMPKGSNIAATVNLQPIFENVEKGMPVAAAVSNMSGMIEEIVSNMPQFDVKILTDYEQMKNKLTMQLIPVAGNEERLKDIPYQSVEDMALVYRFEMDMTEHESSGILATNTMLETYGISAEQLHADALEAAPLNRPGSLRNMNDVLGSMMGSDGGFLPEESPLWVASVEGSLNGASVIQYPGFLEQATETMGGDYYILPSSIHEVLLVPDDGSMQLQELEDMVREINQSEVDPADRLSDNVYHYDSEEHVFENARAFEAREAAKEEAVLADQPNTITVLKVSPGEHPKLAQITTELSDMQNAVGGNIEVTYPFEDNVAIICNEDGKIDGLPLNRAIRDGNGEITDVIAGTFVVTGLTDEDFGSLNQEQIEKFEAMFHQPEAFIQMGHSVMAIPIPEERLAKEAEKAADKTADKAAEKTAGAAGRKPKHAVYEEH